MRDLNARPPPNRRPPTPFPHMILAQHSTYMAAACVDVFLGISGTKSTRSLHWCTMLEALNEWAGSTAYSTMGLLDSEASNGSSLRMPLGWLQAALLGDGEQGQGQHIWVGR